MSMFRQRIFNCTSLLVLVVASLPPSPVFAQRAADRDAQEINAYVLTEAALARYSQATRNLGALSRDVSSDCGAGDDGDDGDDDEGARSIDQAVARIDAIAGARAAIESAGMKTREYVVFGLSVFQAGLASWALAQPGGKLPAGVSKANVDFYRAHERAIAALGASSKSSDCDSEDSA
jgi:hypothetical protein